MAAFLVSGDERLELQQQRVLIGRRKGCDIVVNHPMVSAHHCVVHRSEEDGCWYITDQESTNGTWVNDQEVAESELNDGDIIRLGRSRLGKTRTFRFVWRG